MLTDVRDRLIGWLRDPATGQLPPGVRRLQSSGESIVDPIDCKHGVRWTECMTCSKPKER